jgi:hypothetical protein
VFVTHHHQSRDKHIMNLVATTTNTPQEEEEIESFEEEETFILDNKNDDNSESLSDILENNNQLLEQEFDLRYGDFSDLSEYFAEPPSVKDIEAKKIIDGEFSNREILLKRPEEIGFQIFRLSQLERNCSYVTPSGNYLERIEDNIIIMNSMSLSSLL